MNKQGLIERYKTKYAEEPRDWKHPSVNASRQDLFANFIRDLEQLDEPQKPVVPKFVADWFEENKDNLEFAIWELCVDSYNVKDEHGMFDWIQCSENKPIETLIHMKDGYEVEKEPLYYVYFPEIIASPEMFFSDIEGAYLMKSDDGIELADNNDFDDMKFTEQEIKAIDKRYWAFAVPVEEVEAE